MAEPPDEETIMAGTHENSRGMSYGKKASAEQVSAGIDLSGRHAIVTGANSGPSISPFCDRISQWIYEVDLVHVAS